MASGDPYQTLGVPQTASDEELRRAYRRQVKMHHPDHNGGSAESARRFEAVQEAYARILAQRRTGTLPPRRSPEPGVDARIADMERELRDAREARERARSAAREAAAGPDMRRATDEQLGYVTTEDSFSKIIADALDDIAARLKRPR